MSWPFLRGQISIRMSSSLHTCVTSTFQTELSEAILQLLDRHSLQQSHGTLIVSLHAPLNQEDEEPSKQSPQP